MTDLIDDEIDTHWQLREKIIEQCLWMNSSGLNQGTSGNISVRYKKSMLITPSGVPYDKLEPHHIAKMSLKHNRYEWEGPYKPSSEWHFHRAILQSKKDYGSVVHTHSTYATVLSMSGGKIPACHYMIAAFGGSTVRCAKYATFGTPALSKNILKAMKNRSACLLANHGMVVAGSNLDKAMWSAVELETLSKQYYLASCLGSVNILSDTEIDTVLAKFTDYGPKDKVAQKTITNGEALPAGKGEAGNAKSSGTQQLAAQQSGAQQSQAKSSDTEKVTTVMRPNVNLPK